MRKNIFGRFLCLLMALCMILGTSVVAFAAETTNTVSVSNEETSDVTSEINEETKSPRVGGQVSTGYIAAGGEGRWNPPLPSTGYGKKLRMNTVPTVALQQERVTLILYAPDGSYLGAWNIAIGASQEYVANYPMTGNYTLIVYNDTNAGIYVEAQWF